MMVTTKVGKKPTAIVFMKDMKGTPEGKVSGKKILVSPGLDKGTMPNLRAPEQMPTVHSDPYGGRTQNQAAPRGRGGMGGPPQQQQRGGRGGPMGGGGGGRPEPASAPSNSKQVKALYDFAAENPDELTFQTGAVITVLEELGEWWKGEYGGQVGIFPANYVEVMKTAPPARGGPPRGGAPGMGGPTRGGPVARGGPGMGGPARGGGAAPPQGGAPTRGGPGMGGPTRGGPGMGGPQPGAARGGPGAPRGGPGMGGPQRGGPGMGGPRGAPRGRGY